LGRFVIVANYRGYRFDLLADNHAPIASSMIHKNEHACRKSIERVVQCSCLAGIEDHTVCGFQSVQEPKFEIYKDGANRFRFRLRAVNGQVLMLSDAYKAKASCKNGIDSVIKNSPTAMVIMQRS
jgi:uncharacterized protein YegP (UPF0339 family)